MARRIVRAGVHGETREQAAPVPVFDIGKAGKPDRERLGQIAALHIGGRLVGDGIHAVVPATPLHQQARLANPAATEDHGQAAARPARQRRQPGQFVVSVQEVHYASQHNSDVHKNQRRIGE